MGMRRLWRRLFTRTASIEETGSVFCTLCKQKLPLSDLKKGLAIVIARRNICRVCVAKTTRRTVVEPGWKIEPASSGHGPL